MKTISKAMIALGLLLGSGTSAMADIKWTLSDVAFDNGNTAFGYFWTNDAVNAFGAFNIVVSGPATSAAFTVAIMVDAYLPAEIGAANSGWSEYFLLVPASPLTSAGGTVHLVNQGWGSVDCTGCGTLLVHTHTPEVTGGLFAEPSAINILGAFGIILGTTTFRRRKRATISAS